MDEITLTKREAQKLMDILDEAHGFGGGSFRLECMQWQQVIREKLRQAENVRAGTGIPAVDMGRGR